MCKMTALFVPKTCNVLKNKQSKSQIMASIFTKIINGEMPCYKIAENEHCLAFLDIMPRTKGHVLAVPHAHIHLIPLETIDDINFQKPHIDIEPEDMKEIAEKISFNC